MKRRTKEGECTTTKIMNTLRWAFSLKKKLFLILKFAFFCTLEHSRRKIQTCSLVFDFFCTLQWGVLSELLQQNESESALSKIDQLCLEIHFTTNEHTHTVEPRYSKKKNEVSATDSRNLITATHSHVQQTPTEGDKKSEGKGEKGTVLLTSKKKFTTKWRRCERSHDLSLHFTNPKPFNPKPFFPSKFFILFPRAKLRSYKRSQDASQRQVIFPTFFSPLLFVLVYF